MALPFDTMAFIPYTPGPLRAADYESWLRAVDNPFFNSRPGIADYSNWKVVDATHPLGFTHFDFLGLDSPAALEPVWFDAPLDEFRREWVRLWGYASQGGAPAPVNQHAYRFDRRGAAVLAPSLHLVVMGTAGAMPPAAGCENWALQNLLRKHWAIGRAPEGEHWQLPPGPFNPLGAGALQIRACADAVHWRDGLPVLSGADFAFCAEWLASPTPPPGFSAD